MQFWVYDDKVVIIGGQEDVDLLGKEIKKVFFLFVQKRGYFKN